MNNTASTDTSKTTPQQTPFVKNVATNDAQPAKVEAPTPSTDTDRKAVEPKQAMVDDEESTSRR